MKLQTTFCMMTALLLSTLTVQAATVTVDLGQSAQNFVYYGLGPDNGGLGTYDLGQGACGFNGTTTTCTLSGAFTGSSAGFTGGAYSLVTSYAGNSLSSVEGVSEASNPDYFNYLYFSSTVSMVLDLTPTGGATDVIALVAGGSFVDSSFSFTDVGFACSGVAVSPCTQAEVGLVNGAIGQSPVTAVVSFDVTSSSTPTSTPEPRFLAGTGLSGLMVAAIWFRRKRLA